MIAASDDAARAACTSAPSRRRVLRHGLGVVTTAIAGALSAIAGRAAVGTSFVPRPVRWAAAGRLDDLETGVPVPVTVRVTRRDGYLETVDQQVIFLVRAPGGDVRGLSSSCSHLGCSVTFDRQAQQFVCPCHAGVFDIDGAVVSGPPPRPLATIATRVDGARVLVEV